MEYEIIKRHDLCMMEEIVNAKLQAGWELQGGVSISKDSNTLCYCQAMIKHTEVKINVQASKKVNMISLREFLDSRTE